MRKIKKLNDTSLSVLAFLKKYIDEYGYAPSLCEIGEGCYLSTSSIARHLELLERHNKILRMNKKARAIKVLK